MFEVLYYKVSLANEHFSASKYYQGPKPPFNDQFKTTQKPMPCIMCDIVAVIIMTIMW